jgi:conjugal transfer pilus assembly protein TraD
MRWWDGGARLRAGLVGLNALALGAVTEGWARAAALGAAAAAGLLVARSLRRAGAPPGELILDALPERTGAVCIGRGFEWTLEAAQETVESGRVAGRGEGDLFLPDGLLDRHVLILGTTGTGKTRLLELLALQAVERGDAVVIIDPKGDERLMERVRRAAGPRFRLFSLPHPGKSVRYNPIGRYHDVREVADRVAALLPSSGDALPFRNFGWDIVHTAAREMHGKQPMTLRNLRRCAIDKPIGPLADRPREHYLKMASALIPILSKLSSEQLSPAKGGLSWEGVDQDRLVAYFSLGSLLGCESASAVAKMALLDLQSYVGARYAYGKGYGPVWLLVDELGDVVTKEFIAILNKSRGAGLRVVACGQTASDLEAALGSRAQALQVLGNANTVVQFRAQSAPDAEVFSEMAGERLIRMRSEGAAYEPALFTSGFRDVDDFRARFGETFDWREHALVPPWAMVQLPTFHFFARWEGRVFRGRVPLLR